MYNDKTISVVVAIIGSGALSALISQIFTIYIKKAERKDTTTEVVRLLLKNEIRRLCIEYINRGWVCSYELEDLASMYGCFNNDGAEDVYLDSLIEKVKKLTIRTGPTV